MRSLLDNPRITRKKLWLLLLLAVAIVTTILLAAGLPRLQLLPGRPFPLAGILQALQGSSLSLSNISIPQGFVRLFAACMWLLLIASIIGFIVSSEIRKQVFKRAIIYTIWILLFYSLITALQPYLSSLSQSEESGPSEGGLLDDSNLAETLPTPPDFVINPPQWIVIVTSILIVAFLLGIIWLVWYFLWPRKKDEPLEQIMQEAQQALDDIHSGQDLKDTIRRCYFEMSQILSRQRHFHRHSAMTPREFEQHLAASGLQVEHIKRLTRLLRGFATATKRPVKGKNKKPLPA